MILALIDAVIVLGTMAVIGLLGYLMDRQVDHSEQEKSTPISTPGAQPNG